MSFVSISGCLTTLRSKLISFFLRGDLKIGETLRDTEPIISVPKPESDLKLFQASVHDEWYLGLEFLISMTFCDRLTTTHQKSFAHLWHQFYLSLNNQKIFWLLSVINGEESRPMQFLFS